MIVGLIIVFVLCVVVVCKYFKLAKEYEDAKRKIEKAQQFRKEEEYKSIIKQDIESDLELKQDSVTDEVVNPFAVKFPDPKEIYKCMQKTRITTKYCEKCKKLYYNNIKDYNGKDNYVIYCPVCGTKLKKRQSKMQGLSSVDLCPGNYMAMITTGGSGGKDKKKSEVEGKNKKAKQKR